LLRGRFIASRIRSLLALLVLVAPAAYAATAENEPIVVKDPQYGEVLFYFYQEDYFPAIVRLLAAQSQQQFVNHAEEAELLLGGLYLSYGHHLEAAAIFEKMLAGNVSTEIRNRTWFFLAKICTNAVTSTKHNRLLVLLRASCRRICGAKRSCCKHKC